MHWRDLEGRAVRMFKGLLLFSALALAGTSGTAHAATSGFFKTPSANIVLLLVVRRRRLHDQVRAQAPAEEARMHRLRRFPTNRIFLGKTGRRVRDLLGRRRPVAGEKQAKVLGYGKSKSFGRLKCTSTTKGLT